MIRSLVRFCFCHGWKRALIATIILFVAISVVVQTVSTVVQTVKTLFPIVIVAIAALAVYAIVRRRPS